MVQLRRDRLFFVLAAIGTAVPLGVFLPWLAAHGVDVRLFVMEVFATRASAFFGWDVIISAVVVLVLALGDRPAVPGRCWAITATLMVGISSGLPLYLGLRERALRLRR